MPVGCRTHYKGVRVKPLLDVLTILGVSEKGGSFTATSAKLYKALSVLSYTVYRLENDLNIRLLDRSEHRAKFTYTGKILLEEEQEVLHIVRELERQAIKLYEGWGNELVTGVNDTFPLSLLVPLIEAFHQHHSVTHLKFINGVLGDSWDALTQERVDIIIGMMRESPSSNESGFSRLGDFERVFAVVPHRPLAQEEEPLNRRIIKRYRAIVARDTTRAGAFMASQLLDEQEAATVFDFKIKLELQISDFGCGYLPRYLT